jgi:shikimate kinase
MGAGKTTFGKALARRLNLAFIDTDAYIENRYHKKISELFASEGEEGFRDIEHKILLEVAEIEDVVVATGGGLPCFCDNMALMNAKGLTVFLDAPVEELAARLEAGKTIRPVLQNRKGEALRTFITESLARRRPFYEQAKIHLDAAKFDVEMMVKEVVISD